MELDHEMICKDGEKLYKSILDFKGSRETNKGENKCYKDEQTGLGVITRPGPVLLRT